jgi:hypothetical protein
MSIFNGNPVTNLDSSADPADLTMNDLFVEGEGSILATAQALFVDGDSDGDGIPDAEDDSDGDGIPDSQDADDDGDGVRAIRMTTATASRTGESGRRHCSRDLRGLDLLPGGLREQPGTHVLDPRKPRPVRATLKEERRDSR